jgi:predicted membrane-bound spermidine synthase
VNLASIALNEEDQDKSYPLFVVIILQGVISASSMVVEIVAGRMIAPYVGMSLYTWTAIIAVVLAGFSIGNWMGGKIASSKITTALKISGGVMMFAAISTACAGWMLRLLATPIISNTSEPLIAITLISTGAFFLPSVLAGIPAPILTVAAMRGRHNSEYALGLMYAVGAFGAIIGTLAAGFALIPHFGSTYTLILVSLVYIASSILCFWLGKSRMRQLVVTIPGAVILFLTSLHVLDQPQVCDHESEYFCIRVVDLDPLRPDETKLMVIDHLAHGISNLTNPRIMYTPHAALLDGLARQRMKARDTFNSFHIGGGTYSIPRAWYDRGLSDITVAEIDPVVTEVATKNFWLDREAIRIEHEDARLLLQRENMKYDVIIGDAFTDIAVPEHLITVEFFELVNQRLKADGVFLMNFMDNVERLDAFSAVAVSLQSVFKNVEVWTEASSPQKGERRVFVFLASDKKSDFNSIRLRVPEDTRFSVLDETFISSIIERKSPKLLTDDHAPLAYLMGFDPILN